MICPLPLYLESSMACLKACFWCGGLFVRCFRKNFSPSSISRSSPYCAFSSISLLAYFVRNLKRLIVFCALRVPTGMCLVINSPPFSGSSTDTAAIILRILLIPLSMLRLRLRMMAQGGMCFSALNAPIKVNDVIRCSTEPSIANPLASS